MAIDDVSSDNEVMRTNSWPKVSKSKMTPEEIAAIDAENDRLMSEVDATVLQWKEGAITFIEMSYHLLGMITPEMHREHERLTNAGDASENGSQETV